MVMIQSPLNPLWASAVPVVTTKEGDAVHRRTPATRVRATATVLSMEVEMMDTPVVRGTWSAAATTAGSSATTTTRRTTAANNLQLNSFNKK